MLERLPTVGDVTVARSSVSPGFSHGFTWTVTFETQIGNVESIFVDGNASAIPIAGPDANLWVVEVQRGRSPSLDITVTGLEPGETYFTRVSATNADGNGLSTLANAADGGGFGSNNDGDGIAPLAVVSRTAPRAPEIAGVNAISGSQLEVMLHATDEPSDVEALGYKV